MRSAVHVTLGAVLGLLFSIVPLVEIVLLVVLPLVGIFIVRITLYVRRRDILTVAPMCLVMAVCCVLPTKPLDAVVGPMAYTDMTLAELCSRLHDDHGIVCRIADPAARTLRQSFITRQPMSRRKVLDELSRQTGRTVVIGYCGTGATLLFGAYPSFTYLGEPKPPSGQ